MIKLDTSSCHLPVTSHIVLPTDSIDSDISPINSGANASVILYGRYQAGNDFNISADTPFFRVFSDQDNNSSISNGVNTASKALNNHLAWLNIPCCVLAKLDADLTFLANIVSFCSCIHAFLRFLSISGSFFSTSITVGLPQNQPAHPHFNVSLITVPTKSLLCFSHGMLVNLLTRLPAFCQNVAVTVPILFLVPTFNAAFACLSMYGLVSNNA